MKRISLVSLALSVMAGSVHAGSFQLPNQGLDQSSMGGAGVAYPWNAAAVFYNPALLSNMDNFQLNANIGLLRPDVRYISNTHAILANNTPRVSTPFAIYAGGKFSPESRWGFGLGVYTPFGSNVNWGNEWTGRFLVQDISLSTIFIQPTVSYRISDQVAIGLGVNFGTGQFEMTKALPVASASGEGQAALSGRAYGVGFNAGISVMPSDHISIGLNFRSGVDMKLRNGIARFDVPASLAGSFPNTNFNTEMNLPHIITLGVAGRITPDFTLAADIIYSAWSRYQYTNFDFEMNTPTLEDQVFERLYNNTLAVRLGARYSVTEDFSIMAGVNYDPTPTRKNYTSPEAIDGDRWGCSFGLSYEPTSRLKFNVAANYVAVAEREAYYQPANFGGYYQMRSLSPSFGLTYKFID